MKDGFLLFERIRLNPQGEENLTEVSLSVLFESWAEYLNPPNLGSSAGIAIKAIMAHKNFMPSRELLSVMEEKETRKDQIEIMQKNKGRWLSRIEGEELRGKFGVSKTMPHRVL
jgi:hypothetical protein